MKGYNYMDSLLDIRQKDGVVRVCLGQPGNSATLNYSAIVHLTDALTEAGCDPSVRAVVLEGAGPDFCTGEDPEGMGEWPDRYRDRLHRGTWATAPIPQQELLKILWRLPKPTIAVISGSAYDFGFELACACDIRLASTDAVLADRRVLRGEAIATGITYLLPRLIGLSQAERMLLLGDELSGSEAERRGLIYRAVDAGVLQDTADELVQQVCSMATRSYALIKRQILEQLDLDHDSALLHSLAIRQTHVIEDQQEGLAAFREKRQPQFTGR